MGGKLREVSLDVDAMDKLHVGQESVHWNITLYYSLCSSLSTINVVRRVLAEGEREKLKRVQPWTRRAPRRVERMPMSETRLVHGGDRI